PGPPAQPRNPEGILRRIVSGTPYATPHANSGWHAELRMVSPKLTAERYMQFGPPLSQAAKVPQAVALKVPVTCALVSKVTSNVPAIAPPPKLVTVTLPTPGFASLCVD